MATIRDHRLQICKQVALAHYGLQEIPGPDHNPQISEFLKTTWIDDHEDEVPWCSAFMNYCVEQSGLKGTGSPRAKSWLEWGSSCVPVPGDICVLNRKGGGGHVAFFITAGRGYIALLGGNQDNRVCISDYRLTDVIDFRTAYVTVAPKPLEQIQA